MLGQCGSLAWATSQILLRVFNCLGEMSSFDLLSTLAVKGGIVTSLLLISFCTRGIGVCTEVESITVSAIGCVTG